MKAILEKEKKSFTYEDIHSLPEGTYEITNGERWDVMPASFTQGILVGIIGGLLDEHLEGKGHVAVGEVGIIINKKPLTVRAADVVYISKEKSPEMPKGMLEIPPDLIVEIVSESNVQWELTGKVKDYLSFGVERVILVDPQTETVNIYQKGKREILLYNFDEEFEVLEGLRVKLKELVS